MYGAVHVVHCETYNALDATCVRVCVWSFGQMNEWWRERIPLSRTYLAKLEKLCQETIYLNHIPFARIALLQCLLIDMLIAPSTIL